MEKPVKGSVSFPEKRGVPLQGRSIVGTPLIYWSGGGGEGGVL